MSWLGLFLLLVTGIVLCGGRLEYLHHSSPVSCARQQKGNMVAGGYNWATLSLGDINTGTLSSRLGFGHKADDCSVKKIIAAKYKEVNSQK
jgi:hypothetical protein